MKKTILVGVAFLLIFYGFIIQAQTSLTNTSPNVSTGASQDRNTSAPATKDVSLSPVNTSANTSVKAPAMTLATTSKQTLSASSTVVNTQPVIKTATSSPKITPPPVDVGTGAVKPAPGVNASVNTIKPLTISASSSATTSQNRNTENSSNTVSVPPTIIPQEIPADQGEVTSDFVVTSVVVTETKINTQNSAPTAKVIEFTGKAKPNTYITLYIYSTPIIVTVKTDSQGNWKYSLDQELEDGEHKVYVAEIDNTGNVVAKSDPIFFTKAAASVGLVSSDAVPAQPKEVNFLQQYFIVIALIILVLGVIVSLTIIGLMKSKSTDLPQEPSDNIQ